MIRLSIAVLLAALAVLPGCGLIDSDITNFRFVTDDKEFTIDTADWGLSSEATLPAVPCQPATDICVEASDTLCLPGDTARCEAMCAASNTCSMRLRVALSSEVRLADESEFQTVDNQPLAEVSVESVEYRVIENTLNVDSPVLDLYIGPLGTMTPDGEGARHIGFVESIPAGTQRGFTPITLTDDGRTSLRDFIEGDEYKSPFNIILATQLDLEANDAIPRGRARVAVHIKANARPSL